VKVTSEPLSELDKLMLEEMSTHAAKGVHLQCSREYWDKTKNGSARATSLYKLSQAQIANLPTNNLVAERYLAKFGYLASLSAKRSNRFYKAIRIRDDMLFWSSQTCDGLNKEDLQAMKRLDKMESNWGIKQNDVKRIRLSRSKDRKLQDNTLFDDVLKKCKEHGCPVTNAKEVEKLHTTKLFSTLNSDFRRSVIQKMLLHDQMHTKSTT
jgi:hypothetical protein